jgi:hypothetical protein
MLVHGHSSYHKVTVATFLKSEQLFVLPSNLIKFEIKHYAVLTHERSAQYGVVSIDVNYIEVMVRFYGTILYVAIHPIVDLGSAPCRSKL